MDCPKCRAPGMCICPEPPPFRIVMLGDSVEGGAVMQEVLWVPDDMFAMDEHFASLKREALKGKS